MLQKNLKNASLLQYDILFYQFISFAQFFLNEKYSGAIAPSPRPTSHADMEREGIFQDVQLCTH